MQAYLAHERHITGAWMRPLLWMDATACFSQEARNHAPMNRMQVYTLMPN